MVNESANRSILLFYFLHVANAYKTDLSDTFQVCRLNVSRQTCNAQTGK
jgi:hypothetical protein